MADEPKKDEKEKKDAKTAAEAKPGKAGGLVPIIAAVAVLAAVGGGVGWYFAKSLTPAPVAKPGAEAEGAEGGGHGEAGHGAAAEKGGGHGTGLLATGMELTPIGLKGNVTGSGGTRYITLEVGIWVPKKDQGTLNDASVRRLIQARLEETLKTYQLDDLASPNIMARMRKDFSTAVERLLRSVMPGREVEDKFVLEMTITNLLTQ